MTDSRPTSATRPFRFGVTVPLTTDLRTWREQVRRIADQWLLDGADARLPRLQPSPAALAVAATIADVRVGTWVYAAPLRAPWRPRGKRTR